MKSVPTLIVMLLALAVAAAPASGAASRTEGTTLVSLRTPAGGPALVEVVRKYRLEPVELFYSLPTRSGQTVSGGYLLEPGADLETALGDFAEKHAAFLATAIAEAERELAEAGPQDAPEAEALLADLEDLRAGAELGPVPVSRLAVRRAPGLARALKEGVADAVVLSSGPPASDRGAAPESAGKAESWAPNRGTSKVNKGSTFQTFTFRDTSVFAQQNTYEHETQVYDRNFADYDRYYSTNMPHAYYDTPFADSIDNFTIGTFSARSLSAGVKYYTYMALRSGSARTALVRIKGQLGSRRPSDCWSTWCVWPQVTSGSMATFTAPIDYTLSWSY